ncbi:hypothetical protein Sjap_010227 [Stephania japonica]|uniref:FHA domain-containing protein n=1 Tax=Stephania japonica TaxID=461633 RepID=A0AAP0J9Z8_9MAGN
MGALAPVTTWIPEDDLLLKNAVEAGASLESLAKGAVQFSRRYTTRELQDRWYALLYEPETSEQASACMFQLENATFGISSRSNGFGDSGLSRGSRKRKEESVRSHYYGIRKRICNDSFGNMDDFLATPNINDCSGDGDGCQEQLAIHNEPPIGILGDPIRRHFSIQDTEFDMMHHGFSLGVAPESGVGVENGAHTFHGGDANSRQHGVPNEIMGTNCLYEFVGSVHPMSVDEIGGSDIGQSFHHDNGHKDIPLILGENLDGFENDSVVQDIEPSQAMSVSNLFENDVLRTKELPDFDTSDHPGNGCSDFGRQEFHSPVSESMASFHHLGYSSPVPTEPIWKAIGDMSSACIAIEGKVGEKEKDPEDKLGLHADTTKRINSCDNDVLQHDVFHSQPQPEGTVSNAELNNSNSITDGELAKLRCSLLDFENDVIFLDEEGKELMDKSSVEGLKSILLSPDDVHHCSVSNVSEPQTSVVPDAHDGVVGAGKHALDEKPEVTVSNPEVNLPSSESVPNPHFPELLNGVICCTLNTEDPEIPSNDDVFLPGQSFSLNTSIFQHSSEEVGTSVIHSTMGLSAHQEGSVRGQVIVKKEQDPFNVSLMREPPMFPKMCSNNLTKSCQGKPEFPDNKSLGLASSIAGTFESDLSRSATTTPVSISAGLKEDTKKSELWNPPDFDNPMKPYNGCESTKNHPQETIDCLEQQESFPVDPNLVSRHAEHGSFEMAFTEEQHYEDEDDDVPSFSDIEAMILDMDLGPGSEESCFNREVSRYRYEKTKKAIIRLEQGDRSSMQRTIASRGAFAVLNGRRFKHYIKKQEVLLGRATENDSVDIDLSKEGRAHKISRQQARIKMEEDGSFCLTNLGKCSVLINSKEVMKGHSARLKSSCLIEIRNMRFNFEINETAIKLYISKNGKNNEDTRFKFELSPYDAV